MSESRVLRANAFDAIPDALLGPLDAPDVSPGHPIAMRLGAPSVGRSVVDQTESRACPGIFLRVHSDMEALEAEWRAFEAEADCTAFQCFDWAAKWQRHIGSEKGTRPAIVLGRDADGALLFMFQLAVERSRLARRLTWLGSELCDYNGPLLAPHAAERFRPDRFAALWDEVLSLLRADPRLRFDLVDLSKMPGAIGGQPNPFMALQPALDPSGAHLANLGDDWEAFYAAKRSSATRKRERRQFRHLADFGEVRFVEPSERDDVERTLEALFAQKASSFARMGVENFLARPGYAAFFRDLAADQRAVSFTHVSRLDVGETMAGTSFGLEFRGRYYLLLSSYQDGDLSRYGPGRAHLQELLQRAIAKGFAQFDFTVGDEPYKRDWSDVTLPLYGYFAAATPLGLPIVVGTSAFRKTKRAIKQNPVLWKLFSRMRERMARVGRRDPGAEEGASPPQPIP